MQEWYQRLFNEDYIKIDFHDRTLQEVEGLIGILGLKKSDRILDVCCGYGRHDIPLAAQGYQITGLDLANKMLAKAAKDARAENAPVNWVRGDARDLPFEASFDVALNLFTAFGYFEREGENLRVLQEIERVLKRGGRFLLDTVNHDFLVRYFQPSSWRYYDGVLLLEERHFDAQESRVEGVWTVVHPDGRRREYPHSIRAYTFAELRMLLTLAGLNVKDVYGGYEKQVFDWDAPRMLIVCEK